MPWRAVAVNAELDVSDGHRKKQPDWRSVQFLFVRGANALGESEVGKRNWAIFLCTDARIGMSKVLEAVECFIPYG